MRAMSSWIATVVLCEMVIGGALAASACRSSSRHQAAKLVEQAHAYERGAGVARDYRAAADLLRAACDGGRGDVLACGAWIRAGWRARGTDRDMPSMQALATKICVDRRDPFGCVMTGLLSGREADIPEPVRNVIKDVLEHVQPCDAAHPSECQAAMFGSALSFSDGTAAEARRLERNEQLCGAGIVSGCVELQRASHASAEAIADAKRRLQAACDAGDADACEEAPDRTGVPLKELCAASDYEACGALGCRGDAQAAALATSHGVLQTECDRIGRPRRAESAARGPATLAKMSEFKNQMCACHDQACTDRVLADLQRWMAEEIHASGQFPEPVRPEIERNIHDLDACRDRILTAPGN